MHSLKGFKIKDEKFILLFVASLGVNIFFIWFPSFDHQNLAFWINSASYLQNSIPSFFGSLWPGGPFFLSIFAPLGLSYSFSGYSEIDSVIVLKIILFIFTIFTGIVLYTIVSESNKKFAKMGFLFTLTNPGIIYVNYIWAQLDILPVFFVALSYYFIYYHENRDDSFFYTLISLIPLYIAIFSFYYAVLLIPTFIIYAPNNKRRLNFIVSGLILGVLLFIAEIFLFRGGIYNPIGPLVPTASALYYQGLQRIILIPGQYLISSIGALSIFIPLIIKKYGISPSVSIFVIIMVLLYTSTNAAANNFLWLYPFSFLAISENTHNNLSKRSILITSSFFWTGIVFINLYIGTGIQAGLFYFAYYAFHANILFIHTTYQGNVSTLIYFLFLTSSLIGTLFYLICYLRKNSRKWNPEEQNKSSISKKLIHHGGRKNTSKIVIFIIITIVLLISSSIFNSDVPIMLNNSTVHRPPTAVLLTQYSNGVIAFPVENNTYFIKNNSINFYDNENIILMTRNLSTEFINLSVNENLNVEAQSNVMLFNTSAFKICAYDTNFVNLSKYKTIAPNFTNAQNLTDTSIQCASRGLSVTNFSINTSMIFNSQYFMSSYFYTMLFKVQKVISPASRFNQTVLFGIYNGNTSVNFVVYNESGILSYNKGSFHKNIVVFGNNDTPCGWNSLTFESTGNTLNVSIDGRSTQLNGSFFGGKSKLYIGKQPGNNTTHAFIGQVTRLYSSKTNGISNRMYYDVRAANKNLIYVSNGNKIRINVSDSLNGTMLGIQGKTIFYSLPLSYLIVGKLDPVSYGLSIKFNWLHITPRDNSGYYMIAVFFAFLIPYMCGSIGLIEIYYTRFTKHSHLHSKST